MTKIAFNFLAVTDTLFCHPPFSWLKRIQMCFQIIRDAISHVSPFLVLLFFFLFEKKLMTDLSRSHAGMYVLQVLEIV